MVQVLLKVSKLFVEGLLLLTNKLQNVLEPLDLLVNKTLSVTFKLKVTLLLYSLEVVLTVLGQWLSALQDGVML